MIVERMRTSLLESEYQLRSNGGRLIATFEEPSNEALARFALDFLNAFDEQYPILFNAMAEKIKV